MTAVTELDRIEPAVEWDIAKVTASAGNTFITRIASIVGVFITSGGTHAAGTCSVSGQTITLGGSLSSETVYIAVAGRP
jgi:hypothetical protein